MKKFLYIFSLVFLMACSSEKPSGITGQGPSGQDAGKEVAAPEGIPLAGSTGSSQYSLELNPADAGRSSTLSLASKGFNIQDAKVEWLINGLVVNNPLPGQFAAKDTSKGDRIQAKALFRDKEIVSNIVQIRNSPPVLNDVRFLPEVFRQGDTLSVEASATDIDGDGVTFTYEWVRNGESAGSGTHVQVPLKRGDKVSVKIIPSDGESSGREKTLVKEIGNMPPMITDDRKFNFDGSVWTYQVRATDPDGDTLTYTLKGAPQGMSITQTGLIAWRVPADFRGRAPVTVSVTDGHSGEASYTLAVVIAPESAVTRPR
jgi:hypothetical protein